MRRLLRAFRRRTSSLALTALVAVGCYEQGAGQQPSDEGLYFPAGLAAVLTLGTLSAFRWIENRMPAQFYAHFTVRFLRSTAMPEAELRRVVTEQGFSIANLHYRLTNEGKHFEYRMVVRTLKQDNLRLLAETLKASQAVLEFRIAPTGD